MTTAAPPTFTGGARCRAATAECRESAGGRPMIAALLLCATGAHLQATTAKRRPLTGQASVR